VGKRNNRGVSTTRSASQTDGPFSKGSADGMFEETLRRLQLAYDQSIAYAQALNEEIKVRKQAEGELSERRAVLIRQAGHLEEANTAVRVLLRHRDADKAELEKKMLSNVKELIFPYIEVLKNTRLDAKQTAVVELIENHLKAIVSPFLSTLHSKYSGLTPREIQIAGLIKEGKTTKDIAALINVSPRAVEFHRYNIRIKLGLQNQKTNLRSYLLSLS
jgi:DNA-binding CsgD family transcriptional regulator